MRLDIRRRLPANGASEVTLLSSSPSEFPSDAQEMAGDGAGNKPRIEYGADVQLKVKRIAI
jgi:hypothetical protein